MYDKIILKKNHSLYKKSNKNHTKYRIHYNYNSIGTKPYLVGNKINHKPRRLNRLVELSYVHFGKIFTEPLRL